MTIEFALSGNTVSKNINLILTLNNNELKFDTFLRIYYEQWDIEKKRPKNIYIKKYKKLNNKLDFIKKEFGSYINQIVVQKKEINQKAISKVIKKILQNEMSQPDSTLLFFMNKYISDRKDFICYSTYKRYKVFYNLIQRFEGYHMCHLVIEDINMTFIKNFILFGKEEKYSDNTIYRTIHFVKTILNFIETKGVKTYLREINIKRENQQKEIVSLSEKEIIMINKADIPNCLKTAKDWLIISCYTGQRFSDFIQFSMGKIIDIEGKVCIKFVQKKTKKEIILPLHPVVINILKENENSFPEPLSITVYNEQIKLIAKIAGINYMLNANKRIGHRGKSLILEKWQAMTSHIGRRSFATNFYGKIPTPLLMHATGHSSEQTFLKYINNSDNEYIINLSNYFDSLYCNRSIIVN